MIIVVIFVIQLLFGVFVLVVDFLDFQGGKGLVDCMLVICKNYIRWYINEGYDVIIVEQMKEVIFFYGGVEGVRVVVVDVVIQEMFEKRKIIGINKFNNFEYRDEGVLVR